MLIKTHAIGRSELIANFAMRQARCGSNFSTFRCMVFVMLTTICTEVMCIFVSGPKEYTDPIYIVLRPWIAPCNNISNNKTRTVYDITISMPNHYFANF